jgi:hypothetical protein
MGKTVVDELVTLLTLEDDAKNDKVAKEFEDNLADIQKTAIAVGAALVGVATATFLAVSKFAQGVDEGAKFAKSLDIAYDKLQELEYAQRKAGGSTDSLRNDLAKITQTMSSPIPGEFNQTLLTMGIRTRKANGDLKNADDIMGDLAKKFAKLGDKQAQQLGAKLGLSQGTIRMLQKGTASIEELRKEAHLLGGIIPAKTAEDAEKFGESMVETKTALGGVGADIGGQVLPALIDLVNTFKDFIVANRTFISAGIGTVLRAIVKGFSMFASIVLILVQALFALLIPVQLLLRGLDAIGLLSPIVTAALIAMTAALVRMAIAGRAGYIVMLLFSNTLKVAAVIQGITSAIIAMRTVAVPAFLQMAAAAFAFVAPFLAIAAAIAAVILVLQDLWKFFSGGDSVTGRIVDMVKGIKKQKGTEGDDSGTAATISSPGRRSATTGATINNTSNRAVQGGDTIVNVYGAGDPRAVGSDVANRAGLGRTSQTLKPGNRAPLVG